MQVLVDTFGDDSHDLVIIGACALALYARPSGPPLRTTHDVDCISLTSPWMKQASRLAKMASAGTLVPDPALACRYKIRNSNVVVDILSPDGFNGGGRSKWLEDGARNALVYRLESGCVMHAIPPAYFLGSKLQALLDRGPDILSAKDAEDIISVLVEVQELPDDIARRGLAPEISQLFAQAMQRYAMPRSELAEWRDAHLDRADASERDRVLHALRTLCG